MDTMDNLTPHRVSNITSNSQRICGKKQKYTSFIKGII